MVTCTYCINLKAALVIFHKVKEYCRQRILYWKEKENDIEKKYHSNNSKTHKKRGLEKVVIQRERLHFILQ